MFESMDFASLLPTRSTTEERQAEAAQAAAQDEDMCSMLPSLTWTERLIGCGACMVTGYLLSFGAFFRVKELIVGNPGELFVIDIDVYYYYHYSLSFLLYF